MRVVLSGHYPISELGDEGKRKAWIDAQLQSVLDAHADGFNIDTEDPTRNGTNDTELLTQFVGEMYDAFKKSNQNFQVGILSIFPVILTSELSGEHMVMVSKLPVILTSELW